MIVLFTDYGLAGPYLGQVILKINLLAPDVRVINLLADAPRHNPRASAYLLASLARDFPRDTIFFCVVDPGVGTFKDTPIVLKIDDYWFVGPNNGLFDLAVRRAEHMECWEIHWRPDDLSRTFHGRDLYAPISAMIANGLDIPGEKLEWQDDNNWPDSLYEIIYIDHFGNCMTGINAGDTDNKTVFKIGRHRIPHADTFARAKQGKPFWYQNSNGLVEIALNQESAGEKLNINIGTHVQT